MLNVIFILLGVILLFNFIKALIKSDAPLKRAVISMLTGIGSLAAASLIAGLFQVQIAVNIYTVFIALVLGAPGVALIFLKMFLI
jgi:inhibitor of the pro-sigma K processing machinery